jgi:hypothetical protein
VQDKENCRCYSRNSRVLRQKGICLPVMDPTDPEGKKVLYERVPVAVKRRVTKGPRAGQLVDTTQCVKAGGRVAKKKLDDAACPPGKVLKVYPNGNRRCVKASAANGLKDCPVNLVVAEKVQTGVARRRIRTPGGSQRVLEHPWTKTVQRCVKPGNVAKLGYRALRQGTQPLRPYRVY